MAGIKMGPLIAGISGSIGGQTFGRNRSGFYVRARTTPVNPNTDRQQVVRGALAQLTARWAQVLTDPQRTAWNLYAASVVMKNKLGEDVFLTGFNHFLRANVLRIVIDAAAVDDGPTVFELPEHDPTYAVVISEAAQTVSITYNAGLAWADETGGYMFHFQGKPQNPQREFFGGPWRLLGMTTGVDETPPAAPDILGVQFAVAEGQKDWCYSRIAMADGRLSAPFRDDVLVVA